jgi:ERCC4-type nuclease
MCQERPQIRIVADDREAAGGVVGGLKERTDVTLEIRRLRCGDYLVEDDFVVERKTLRDFATSVVDGRLFRQASAMSRNGRRGILILEGTAATAGELGLSREALQGALITVGVFHGLAVLRSAHAAETVRLLTYLGDQAARVASDSAPRHGTRPKGKRARQLHILQSLPGIGPARAKRLLERYRTVEKIATIPANELAVIDGIGQATATKVRWALNEPPSDYPA